MRSRRAHVIKDNKNTEVPHHVIFFDTETREAATKGGEVRLSLRFGAACYVHRREVGRVNSVDWCDFVDADVFWDWVQSHCYARSRTYLVAHNIVFDFKVLGGFKALKADGWTLKKLIINGTSNIWEFRKADRTIVCLDNMNFFKSSLATLGESVGIAKLKMPDDAAPYEEWRIYCRRDVEVMVKAWDVWITFIKVNDLGTFGKTLASQAMNAYRHRFMPHKIYIHTLDRAIKVERESYHGGRTECFFIGKPPAKRYHILDVNSMYPSVMHENAYPTKLIKIRDNITVKELRTYLKRYCVTAEVELEVTAPVFGVVRDGRLIFPTGRFKTSLSSRELALAAREGWIRHLHRTLIYEKAPLFKEYVDFFYHRRMEYKDEGNVPFAYLCKIMLNSLYGKFGQRNEVFEKVGEDSEHADGIERYYDIDLAKQVTRRVVNGIIEESTGVQEGWNTLVAIAATITADARLKLWSLIETAGRENVYYCDTDSIFTNDAGLRRSRKEIKEGALGALSLKGSSDTLIIHGAKDYIFGDAEVIKGIRKDAVRVNDSTFKQTRFEGFAGALRKNRLDEMVLSTVQKSLRREYKKGILLEDGRIKPYELSDPLRGGNDRDDRSRRVHQRLLATARAVVLSEGMDKDIRVPGLQERSNKGRKHIRGKGINGKSLLNHRPRT